MISLDDAEGRFALISRDALSPVRGQADVLNMMQASLADVPELIRRVRQLEATVARNGDPVALRKRVADLEGRMNFIREEIISALAVPA